MDEPAAQFVSMLKRIGCPQADTLNPASIEWLFENESIACWLEYLSASLHSSNMVSESELQMYCCFAIKYFICFFLLMAVFF